MAISKGALLDMKIPFTCQEVANWVLYTDRFSLLAYDSQDPDLLHAIGQGLDLW